MPSATDSNGSPFDSVLTGLQNFSQGGSAASGITSLGLSLFGQNANQQSDVAVGTGMQKLSQIMTQTRNDPAKAMLQFAQSPEGMEVMKTPGAFKKLIDQFHESLQQPPIETATAPLGQATVAGRANQPPMINQAANPQQTVEQPGTNNRYWNGGNQVMSSNQPTTESQTFADYALKSGMSPGVVGQMAAINAGKNDAATRLAMGQQLVNMGMPEKAVTGWVTGTDTIMPDTKIPGRFIITHNVGPQGPTAELLQLGPKPQPSLTPSYTSPGTAPEQFNSSPQQQQLQKTGQNMPPYAKPDAQPTDTNAQNTAKKYNVPVEAIKADGTIDPVKAYGPTSVMALGAGLPALAQNNAGIIGRWFDPRNTDESSEIVSKAEIAMGALKYLSTGMAEGSRVTKMVDAVLEMGPEHEKMNDPIYATDQLSQMRSTFEGMARVNQREISNSLQEGITADNSVLVDMKKQNIALEQILSFLPSNEALGSMKQAIKDGKIANVPSVTSAGSTIGRVTSSAVSHGAQALFGASKADTLNNDVPGTMTKIEKATPKDLTQLSPEYGRLDPVLQRAFDARISALRSGGKATTKPIPDLGQKVDYSQPPSGDNPTQRVRDIGSPSYQWGQVTTPSGKKAVIPPPVGQSNDMYMARPANPFSSQ